MKKIQSLEDWSITNNKILTGYIDEKKMWTRPLVSRKGVDRVIDKDGNQFKLGQQHTGATDKTPEDRADDYLTEAVVQRYLVINSLPEVKKNATSNPN
jgi:hypothetical protein